MCYTFRRENQVHAKLQLLVTAWLDIFKVKYASATEIRLVGAGHPGSENVPDKMSDYVRDHITRPVE